MVTIVQKDDAVLFKKALPVTKTMFGGPELKKIIRNMKSALSAQDDGVAIAAPQIGVSMRIFVVSGRVMEFLHPEKIKLEKKYPDIVFINPKILKLSKETEMVEEGCLSVRYLYGKVKRSKKAKIRAYDENGEVFEIGGSGLLAQIFQHETDHLEGQLFIDKATEIQNIPPKSDEKAK